MEMRSQTQRVADRFGGRQAMIAATGLAEHSVSNWMRTGRIPEGQWLDILLAARRVGAPLTPYDFVAHTSDALTSAIAAEMRAATSGPAPASSAL